MHHTRDLPALLGLLRGDFILFLRQHRGRIARVRMHHAYYYSDESVEEMKPLVAAWLAGKVDKRTPTLPRDRGSIARLLGLKNHLIKEFLNTFAVAYRRGLTEAQVDELRALVPWFLDERARRSRQNLEDGCERNGARTLIPAAGERRSTFERGQLTTADAKTELAEQRRRAKAAQKERKCLRCWAVFLSEGPGNRLCHSCKRFSQGVNLKLCSRGRGS